MLLDEPTNHLDIAATEWLENWLARRAPGNPRRQPRPLFSRPGHQPHPRALGRTVVRLPRQFLGLLDPAARTRQICRTYERQQEYVARTEDFIRRNKQGQKSAGNDREKKLARLDEIERPPEIAELAWSLPRPVALATGSSRQPTSPRAWAGRYFRNFRYGWNEAIPLGFLVQTDAERRPCCRRCSARWPRTRERSGWGRRYDRLLRPAAGKRRSQSRRHRGHSPGRSAGPDARTAAKTLGAVRRPRRAGTAKSRPDERRRKEQSGPGKARHAQNVNVLVLDEPTNHLDLWARDSLEHALRAFEGTLLFVSHDRYFVDRSPERHRVWELVLEIVPGKYSDYVHFASSGRRICGLRKRTSRRRESDKSGRDGPAIRTGFRTPTGSAGSGIPLSKNRRARTGYRRKGSHDRQLDAEMADPQIHRVHPTAFVRSPANTTHSDPSWPPSTSIGKRRPNSIDAAHQTANDFRWGCRGNRCRLHLPKPTTPSSSPYRQRVAAHCFFPRRFRRKGPQRILNHKRTKSRKLEELALLGVLGAFVVNSLRRCPDPVSCSAKVSGPGSGRV